MGSNVRPSLQIYCWREQLLARSISLAPTNYLFFSCCFRSLIFAFRYATEGFRDGTLVGGDGAERELIRKVTDLRAEYFSIGDLCAGRMPIAYVQLIQILVDILVWLAPFALYSDLGSLSIPLCAILTHFFKGLLELSKSFLDPFGNDGYPNQNIRYVRLLKLCRGICCWYLLCNDHNQTQTFLAMIVCV